MAKRKPYVPSPVLGRVERIGFWFRTKPETLVLHINLIDAPIKMRREVMKLIDRIQVVTGGNK